MSKAKSKIAALGVRDARLIATLLADFDAVDRTLQDVEAIEDADAFHFGEGTAYVNGDVRSRRVGRLNISAMAFQSMLEESRKDIMRTLKKLGVVL